MVAPNIGVIYKARHCRNQSGNNAGSHAVESAFRQTLDPRPNAPDDVQEKAQDEEPDGKVNKEWMQRMPKWFSLQNCFEHQPSFFGIRAPPSSAMCRHFSFDRRATPIPYP